MAVKASLRTGSTRSRRASSRCAPRARCHPESRGLSTPCDAVRALMAVFMEKHTPKSQRQLRRPPLSATSPPPAPAPAPRARAPRTTRRAAPTPAPASTSGCSASIVARAAAKTSPTPPAPVHARRTLVDIARRSCARRRRNQALPALSRRGPGALPRRDARTAPTPRPGLRRHLLIAQIARSNASPNRCALIGQLLSERRSSATSQLHRALAQWERQAIERLLAQPAMHVDETSLRVDRKNHWIHVYSAGTLTVKRLHPKRGCEAIEHRHHPALRRRRGARLLGLLLELHGSHALCGSHLLRAHLHRRGP